MSEKETRPSSDECIVKTALSSSTEGTTGYHVHTAGKRITFSIANLSVFIFNPHRETITFCLSYKNSVPTYHTYARSKIRITTISQDKNPAVLAAEKILKRS